MEAVAKMFEQEKGVSQEVEKRVKCIHLIEDDYVPFSEVNLHTQDVFVTFGGR
jgi:hypothetical protein